MLQSLRNRATALVVVCLCLTTSGCKVFSLPLVSAVVYPLWKPASDSIDASDYRRVVTKHRSTLATLSIGVLRGPPPPTGAHGVNARPDELLLLRDYLRGTGLFSRVELVDDPVAASCDFAIVCSADCIRETTLDPWMYGLNWGLLGLGFILGIPYQDTRATYLVEAVFYEVQPPNMELAGASIVFNHRRWFGHNLYWEPDVYGARSFESSFEQLLYDFLVESGCLR